MAPVTHCIYIGIWIRCVDALCYHERVLGDGRLSLHIGGQQVDIVLFWLFWGGVFLLAALGIVIRLATRMLLTMGRKPLLGVATFTILVSIGFGVCLYVFLSDFALGPDGHVTGQSLEIGAIAFLVVATVFVYDVRSSGQLLAYVYSMYRSTKLLNKKRYTEAQVIYERMLAKHPQDANAWYGKAQTLTGQRHWVEALLSCEKAVATLNPKPSSDPFRARILLLKSGILLSMYRLNEALTAIDQSLTLKPNYPYSWAQKAYLLQRAGFPEQALASAERALNGGLNATFDIWQGMALVAKAGALNSTGNYADALDTARRALPLGPESSTVWIIQADALAHLGQSEEAQAAALQGLAKVAHQISTDPDGIEYWKNKSVLLRMLGRMSEAEAAETQAHTLIEKAQAAV